MPSRGRGLRPDPTNLLAWYRTTISDGKLQAVLPRANHVTQQIKSSGFSGAGSATVTGLLTTDIITAAGDAPTCSVDGTLTFPGPDCWDIYWHRDGVLIDYFPGINVGGTFEIGAKGVGNVLYLTDTDITERLDGTGTNYANEGGFTVADGVSQWLEETQDTLIGAGWRIPALYGSPGECASWSEDGTSEDILFGGQSITFGGDAAVSW